MTILEAIRDLNKLDEEATMYAEEPWAGTSAVIVEVEPAVGGLPPEAQALGLSYFIEVSIAKEFLEGWEGNPLSEPTLEERVRRLIRFAVTDA